MRHARVGDTQPALLRVVDENARSAQGPFVLFEFVSGEDDEFAGLNAFEAFRTKAWPKEPVPPVMRMLLSLIISEIIMRERN